MSATVDSEPLDGDPATASLSDPALQRRLAVAARRLSCADALLAGLALLSFALVFTRALERWRVTPNTTAHRIDLLGQNLSYPAANVAAIVILALALLGAVVVAVVIVAAAGEITATRRLHRHLAALTRSVVKDAFVIEDAQPQAFCAGFLRPRVYVTTGALAILDEEALDAVLMHERHHAERRDPLRLATSRVLARALFFLPGLVELGRHREVVAEISADQRAIETRPENRSALARAMLGFTDSPAAGASTGIEPARVDHLLGQAPTWRFPTLVFGLTLLVLALLAAVAILLGQVAAGSASLAPPFLSAAPCVVVLALIPAGLTLVAVVAARWRRREAT
jgi:bla regulator protein blaR1